LYLEKAPFLTSLFTREFLSKTTWLPSQREDKLKGRHFDTVQVTEAESGGAEQPHRTRLTECIYKMAEVSLGGEEEYGGQ
jgi:hypothetical protein